MTETARTVTYIGVAVLLLVVAGFVNRKPAVVIDDAPEVLFTALKSPDDVAGLEIVTADDAGGPDEFRVVRGVSGWTLPLHNNYPADAEKEVASAAASLIDLKVLSVVSTLRSKHAEYGVVDPENASPGAEGVGKLVKVLDKSGNDLVRLIVGKQDTQTGDAMDSQELRFVRALPHDAVYRVAMPSAKFSTSFADWIETDLLKLDPWDITDVTLKDYTFDVVTDPLGRPLKQNYDQLSTMELAFNDKDSKWLLKKLVKFENDEPKPVELAADEELNSTRLNEMKTALDDLKIVDVRPKPAGMSANLKANKTIFADGEAVGSLRDVGFYPVQVEGGEPEILSSDGEVLVTMKDGVEYTLRFGGVAGIGQKEDEADADAKKKEKTDAKAKESENQGTTLNRFIMVSARFNPDLIPKPETEDAPATDETKKPEDKKSEGSDQPGPASTKAPEPQTENSESGANPEEKGKDAVKSNDDSLKKQDTAAPKPDVDDKSAALDVSETLQFVMLQDNSPAAKKTKSAGDAKSDKSANSKSSDSTKAPAAGPDEKSKSAGSTDENAKDVAAKSSEDGAAKDADSKASGAKKADESKNASDDAKTGQTKSDQEKAALDRKRLEKENELKRKEYDDKIKKGEEKAAELNARFAGWYYVVSEATYRKIHLNRDDVIKKKADAKKTETGAADDTDDADAGLDALKIPPLKIDPFQQRGDETKDEQKNTDEKKVEDKNDDARKDEEKD